MRRVLPHGGSLPESEWRLRHRVVVSLLGVMAVVVPVYALATPRVHVASYAGEFLALLAFGAIATWNGASHTWRSVGASLGLLTGAATLVDISGGLIEMHFTFFVIIVVLTLYEEWLPFLLAVAFVLIHHGIMGTIDPGAVFGDAREAHDPWAWAGIHAMFMALAGIAGITAWGLNERVRDRMRATQRELERLGLTDPLTGVRNRRSLMNDLEEAVVAGDDVVLAIFDLDGFKEYNDRFGHPAGDSLLIRLTAALESTIEGHARAYRLGGDEFCVLSGPVAGDDLDTLVERWRACFSERGEGFSISASSGAVGIPQETTDASEALRLCDRRMYATKHSRRVTAARQTRDVLLAALAARDGELGEHLTGVAIAAKRVGARLGVARRDLQDLVYAAELHDVGKVAIPDSILSKPGPLDAVEWDFMRRHTVIGERILSVAPSMQTVATIVRATHERCDGGGYPDGVSGEAIPLAARIIAVCDAYDAMVSVRPYRPATTHAQALAELRDCVRAQFDPRVVDAFVAEFPKRGPESDPSPLRRPEDPALTAAIV
ncbi:MAG TPA: HD domain-containing phosphohydrolase [Solirubrobacteraceae bacterium]|nr:HD domain-containing phosphohydrolase [Solirubrobacteraceae bacterium]